MTNQIQQAISRGDVMISKASLSVVCILSLSAFGCNENAKSGSESEEAVLLISAEEAITAEMSNLIARGLNVEDEGRQALPNGELQYARILIFEKTKKPVRAAIWKTGNLMPYGEARKLYQAEYRKAYGSLSESLASALNNTSQSHTKTLAFAGWLDGSPAEVILQEKKIRELDPGAIIRKEEPFIAFFSTSLHDLIGSGVHRSSAISSIYPLGMPKVNGCSANPAVDVNPATQGGANWSKSANTFNAAGFYGQGVKVGVMEPHAQGTGIWDGHISMVNLDNGSGAGPQYQTVPDGCDKDIQCPEKTVCRPSPNGRLQCVTKHLSWVASRISSAYSPSDNRHASKVSMYIPDFSGSSSPVQLYNRVVDSYKWLIEQNQVKIINESWSPIIALQNQESIFPTFHDSLQTWYTFHEGVTFVNASGNPGNHGGGFSGQAPFEEVDCHALNTICVGSVDAACTYNNYLDDAMDLPNGSAWRNPYMSYQSFCSGQTISPSCVVFGSLDSQIERPDVVAEGSSPLVMNIYPDFQSWGSPSYEGDLLNHNGEFTRFNFLGYPDSYQTRAPIQGTSFAAPIITGMVAMCENASVETTGNSIGPLMHKTLVRMLAEEQKSLESSQNPLFYPTYSNGIGRQNPLYTKDYFAGAGIQESSSYLGYCRRDFTGEPGTTGGRGSGTFTPGTGQSFPEELVAETDGNNQGGSSRGDVNAWITNRQSIIKQQAYEYVVLEQIGSVEQGERVRAVLTFDACPGQNKSSKGSIENSTLPVNPNNSLEFFPSADIELALCGVYEGSPSCEVISDSAMDSTEGFDKVFTRSMEQVELRMVIPQDATGCFSNQINWAYAYKYWYFI